MSRGRHANHVHVTGTPTGDCDHKAPVGAPPVATLDDAVATLQAVVVRVGAESSAHTLLDQQHTATRTVPRATPRATPRPRPGADPGRATPPSRTPPRRRHNLAPQLTAAHPRPRQVTVAVADAG